METWKVNANMNSVRVVRIFVSERYPPDEQPRLNLSYGLQSTILRPLKKVKGLNMFEVNWRSVTKISAGLDELGKVPDLITASSRL